MSRSVDVLAQALRDLQGFARRNEERAEKAVEAAKLRTDAERNFNLVEAEARHHEAVRVRFVIEARVREALESVN